MSGVKASRAESASRMVAFEPPPFYIIDHCVIEHSGIAVLVLDIDAVTGNLVVERSFRNLQLGRFLPRGEEERPHLDLRPWKHIVLKEKAPAATIDIKMISGLITFRSDTPEALIAVAPTSRPDCRKSSDSPAEWKAEEP